MPGIEARFLDRAVHGPVAILYEFSGNPKNRILTKFQMRRQTLNYSL